MGNDPTSADTRLADYLLRVVPPATDTLTQLTVGGYFPRGRIWVLHSRVRYFDPDRRRAGLPPDVAALVHELKDDAVTVTLVNLNQVEPRNLVVQAGAYAEHLFTEADGSALTVPLGAGRRQETHAENETLRQPPDTGLPLEPLARGRSASAGPSASAGRSAARPAESKTGRADS